MVLFYLYQIISFFKWKVTMKECLGEVFISLSIILMLFTVDFKNHTTEHIVFLLRLSRELGIKNDSIL